MAVAARLTHDCPETQELAPGAGGNILNERSRVPPVPEANAWSARNATKVNHQSQDDQENDKEDLEEGEPEFDFAINPDGREPYRDREDDCDNDPDGLIDVCPILEEDTDGADFSRDGKQVSVDKVVAGIGVSILQYIGIIYFCRRSSPNRKSHRWVKKKFRMSHE